MSEGKNCQHMQYILQSQWEKGIILCQFFGKGQTWILFCKPIDSFSFLLEFHSLSRVLLYIKSLCTLFLELLMSIRISKQKLSIIEKEIFPPSWKWWFKSHHLFNLENLIPLLWRATLLPWGAAPNNRTVTGTHQLPLICSVSSKPFFLIPVHYMTFWFACS